MNYKFPVSDCKLVLFVGKIIFVLVTSFIILVIFYCSPIKFLIVLSIFVLKCFVLNIIHVNDSNFLYSLRIFLPFNYSLRKLKIKLN